MLMRVVFYAVSVLFLLFVSCGQNTDDRSLIPIEDLFAKQEKTNFSLSPDGRRVAYLGIHDHCKNIFILDLVNSDSSKQLTYQSDINVQYFFWANDEEIIFSNSESPADSLRLLLIDVHSGKYEYLLPPSEHKARWVHTPAGSDELLLTMNERDSAVFDLYRINLADRSRELVDENPGNIVKWLAAKDGKVRLALTSDSVEEGILYRAEEGLPFREIKKIGFSTSINPFGFAENSNNIIYTLSNIGRDKLALVKMDVSTGQELEELYSDAYADVNYRGYSSTKQTILFASSTLDKENLIFFDKSLEQKVAKIKKEFKDCQIDILDADLNHDKLLFKVYSDVFPGGVYLLDTKTEEIMPLSVHNPNLETRKLNPTESVSFQARDDRKIFGYITYPKNIKKNNAVVVLVHDGPGRRDHWGFNPEVQFLTDRGYAVFQINYRGSSGYGKEFWAAGFKEWGGKIQTDIIDGVTWLIHEGIADKNRIAVMGTGFGGYSALHAATFNSSVFRCAISASGFSNMFTFFKEIPPHWKPYLQLYYQIIGNPYQEPDLFKAISPLFHADRVKIPVMFVQGGRDRFSSVTDANQFVKTLKNNNVPVRYLYNEEEGRRIRKEENIMSYYLEVEGFLQEYLK